MVLGNTGDLTRINDGGTSYRFTGWNTSSTGNEETNVGATFIMGSENEILYAQWTHYVLRDTGPAGGYIFYDNGSYVAATSTVPSWRYLEAAPSDQSLAPWGCESYEIDDADGEIVGTGEQNTIDIEAGCTTSGIAADICTKLSSGGYDDWFLPSIDELYLMRENLHNSVPSVGGFADGDYWSSSEYYALLAWCQNFPNGPQAHGSKDKHRRVRAIRAF